MLAWLLAPTVSISTAFAFAFQWTSHFRASAISRRGMSRLPSTTIPCAFLMGTHWSPAQTMAIWPFSFQSTFAPTASAAARSGA